MRTAIYTRMCIFLQLSALFAQRLMSFGVVVLLAIEANHEREEILFFLALPFNFFRRH